MQFYCNTCGKEILLEEGTVSWIDEDDTLRDFKITHKDDQNHSCDPRHVGYVHLSFVTGISGFMKFNEVLYDYWAKGYTLDDAGGLKKALNQIGISIWEKQNKNI